MDSGVFQFIHSFPYFALLMMVSSFIRSAASSSIFSNITCGRPIARIVSEEIDNWKLNNHTVHWELILLLNYFLCLSINHFNQFVIYLVLWIMAHSNIAAS